MSSYTLYARKFFGEVLLDADAYGYWEDYLPLKYFAKSITNSLGKKDYDLDFMQFNVEYPSVFSQNGSSFDTSQSDVKFFTNFQLISSGANLLNSLFGKTEAPPISGVISPGNDWPNTRYEVLNDYVIYPPKNVSLNELAISSHMELRMKNIFSRTTRIRSLQFASQALDALNPNEIKTRYGQSLFPYTKTGIYFNYKKKNPFSIYKGTTPYLYLTKNSGIRLRGEPSEYENRGMAMLINEERASNYQVVAMQSSVLLSENDISDSAQQIFSIESSNEEIGIYAISAHPEDKRAFLFILDKKTGRPNNNFRFFINGKLSYNPVVSTDQWNTIGIAFANKLTFNSITGRLNITGTALVNNLSYYKSTGIQQAEAGISSQWVGVSQSAEEELEWEDWLDLLWEELLLIEETKFYGSNPSDIYKSFVGSDKIIVGDSTPIKLKNYSYKTYVNASRSPQIYEAL